MGAAHVPDDSHCKLAIKMIKCAAQLHGLWVVIVGEKCATQDVHVFDKNPNWSKNLRVWGEAGIIKEGPNRKSGDCELEMMFVGYSDHELDSVSMWNSTMNGIVTTCDLIWMKQIFLERPMKNYINIELMEAMDIDVTGTNDVSINRLINDDDQRQTL